MPLLRPASSDFCLVNLDAIPRLHTCKSFFPYLLIFSAGELIFQAKRDTASYLKELAAAGKITYTLVATGASSC